MYVTEQKKPGIEEHIIHKTCVLSKQTFYGWGKKTGMEIRRAARNWKQEENGTTADMRHPQGRSQMVCQSGRSILVKVGTTQKAKGKAHAGIHSNRAKNRVKRGCRNEWGIEKAFCTSK